MEKELNILNKNILDKIRLWLFTNFYRLTYNAAQYLRFIINYVNKLRYLIKKVTFYFNSVALELAVGRRVKLQFKLNFSWNNDALHARCRAEVPAKLCQWHFRWLV